MWTVCQCCHVWVSTIFHRTWSNFLSDKTAEFYFRDTQKFNSRIKCSRRIACYAWIIRKRATKDWRVTWMWIDFKSFSSLAFFRAESFYALVVCIAVKCFVCRKAMLWCFCNVMTSNIFSPFWLLLPRCSVGLKRFVCIILLRCEGVEVDGVKWYHIQPPYVIHFCIQNFYVGKLRKILMNGKSCRLRLILNSPSIS